MKCHYEVLDVARDASETEIKAAYRKLALRWHPDKNPDDELVAKDRFQLVQQAYDVLGDGHERAWYDKHREEILYGGRNGADYKDDSVDVFRYFTTSCFAGYGDDERGFYAVYRNVFLEIAAEDVEYTDAEGEYDAIPTFGDGRSDYDEVVGPFYAYWAGYSTKKSYAWLDPYGVRASTDRRVMRMLRKENAEVRRKARKARNDEVRNLVAYVRKRDKRVQAHAKLLERRASEHRTAQERLRLERLAKRNRELSLAKEKEQEWTKFENVRTELEEIEKRRAAEFGEELSDSCASADDRDRRDADGGDPLSSGLYCTACNKVFKTPRAFENHESSKKHRENVERLRERMLRDDDDGDDLGSDRTEPDARPASTGAADVGRDGESKKCKKKKKKKKSVATFGDDDDDANGGPEFELEIDGLSKKQKKKKKNCLEESVTASRRNARDDAKSRDGQACPSPRDVRVNGVDDAAAADAVATNGRAEESGAGRRTSRPAVTDVASTCAVCRSAFPSKNKLFDHLKKTGHSVPIQEKIACADATKTNRKRK